MFVERVLHAPGGMNGVWSFVRGAHQIARGSAAAHQAARAGERVSARASRKAAASGGEVRVVDALEGSGPSVLRQIVVVNAKAGANHGLLAVARRVSNPQPRRDLLAVILRKAGHNRNPQRMQGHVGGVIGFASARTRE